MNLDCNTNYHPSPLIKLRLLLQIHRDKISESDSISIYTTIATCNTIINSKLARHGKLIALSAIDLNTNASFLPCNRIHLKLYLLFHQSSYLDYCPMT